MSDNGKKLIEVKNLTKKFGDHTVLDGITTDICQGEVVAIIGPSGCGKSTFLRSLNLLEIPTSGQILFEGIDLTDKSVDINKVRQKIGMVFQQFNLFPNHTIKDNITLAPVKLGLKGDGTFRARRTAGEGGQLSVHVIRRAEAAYRDREIACDEPGCHVV